MIRPPNLIFLAGPNGSGKSTFFDRRLAKWNLAFVNPDVIAKEIAPEDPSGAAFRANAITKLNASDYWSQVNLSLPRESVLI